MRLYGVYCKCSHIDLKCQEYWVHAHTPHTHTPLTCLPLVAVMAVFCCVVLRDVALAEAARISSRKKVAPLPTAVTCSISLSLSFTLLQTVCQAERCLPFIEHFLTPLYSGTLCEGVRNAVSYSLKWPLASWSLPVLTTCVYSWVWWIDVIKA